MTNITRRTFVQGAPLSALAAAASPASASIRQDVKTEAAIVAHARAIMDLLRESAPEGAMVKGFSFTAVDGEIRPDSIWASAITEDYRLVHLRPSVRFNWFASAVAG
ncbi:hypothetical protein [Pseudooceanicola sp. MF1-13]|uniref:hypothetical protein n=1 Tax=Pseudooceanicola sp. MF1-13 TaxID=3379095 RepID=UPI0038925998